MNVIFSFSFSLLIISSKLEVEEVSKLAVGSSAKINFGFDARALATATLCCCPPDNSRGSGSD